MSVQHYKHFTDSRLTRQFLLYQRLFEMDYDQHSGHYRLLDSFGPEVRSSSLTARPVSRLYKLKLRPVMKCELISSSKPTSKPNPAASTPTSTAQT